MRKIISLLLPLVLSSAVAGPRLVIDTDINPDFDDAGALAVAHALADREEVRILAVTVCNRAFSAVPIVEAINAYYGRNEIPVGVVGAHGLVREDDWHDPRWTDALVSRFGTRRYRTSAEAPPAVSVLRRALSESPDDSVTICTLGFFTNIADLLDSQADDVSSLSGIELVRRKVRLLVAMAGRVPEGRSYNIGEDVASARKVLARWPGRILFSPWELGAQIETGTRLVSEGDPHSPVRMAFDTAMRQSDRNGRKSWDQVSVYAAIRESDPMFGKRRGWLKITDDAGRNTWEDSKEGPHALLVARERPERIGETIEGLMAMRPRYAVRARSFSGADAARPSVLMANEANLAGTDHLGRRLVSREIAGPVRPGRQVGLFYYLWLGQHGTQGPYDISKMEAVDPDVMDKPDSPLWPDPSHSPMLHWGEPLFGYYLSTDEWVLRRHVEMFMAAGIDVLYFDTTNGYHYREVTDRLFPILQEYHDRGFKVPKFCYYMAPNRRGSGTSNVLDVWLNYYRDRKFADLYFIWEGKPLIIAHPDRPYRQEILDFFTWRRPTWCTPSEPDTWYWGGMPTQNVACATGGKPEMMALTVSSPHLAMDAPAGVRPGDAVGCSEYHWGLPVQTRSWHDGAVDRRPQAAEYGFFFQNQIDWALSPERNDVPLAFVCQWNEWIVPFLTRKTNIHYSMRHWLILQDEYNLESSRDIEPMRGGYRDAYYLQLVNFVRRFKGLFEPVTAGKDEMVVYREPTGDIAPRNHPGYDACGVYRNDTGRNEFSRLTVCCDGKSLVFGAETADMLLPCKDGKWMNLFLRAGSQAPGNMGYTHCVTNGLPGVECQIGEKDVSYRIPLTELGLENQTSFSVEFKWSDNRQSDDPMDFYVNGDAAPRGRMNWLFLYDENDERE